MRFAVLAAANSWYLHDLKRAARNDHEVVGLSFSELAGEVGNHRPTVRCGEVALADFDAVIVRSMPPGSLEQVVFRMNALAQLEANGVAVVNSPRALEIAIDKYLSAARLTALRASMPETVACQTVDDAMAAFETLGGDAVIKPVFGGEGRGITRVSDADLALRAFKMLTQMNAVILLQKFIPHRGFDVRLFVLGGRVYGMKRVNARDWRTNVSRGATAEPLDVDDGFTKLARVAADVVGAHIAGIDILPGADGTNYLLEVNAVPGWKALANTLNVDIGAEVLQSVTSLVHAQRQTRSE